MLGKTTLLLKAIEASCEKYYRNYFVFQYRNDHIGKSFVEEFYVKFNMDSFDEQILYTSDLNNLQSASKIEFNDTAYSNELLGIMFYDMIHSIPFVKYGMGAVPYQFEYLENEVMVQYKFIKPLDFTSDVKDSKAATLKMLDMVLSQVNVRAEVLDRLDVRQINYNEILID